MATAVDTSYPPYTNVIRRTWQTLLSPPSPFRYHLPWARLCQVSVHVVFTIFIDTFEVLPVDEDGDAPLDEVDVRPEALLELADDFSVELCVRELLSLPNRLGITLAI